MKRGTTARSTAARRAATTRGTATSRATTARGTAARRTTTARSIARRRTRTATTTAATIVRRATATIARSSTTADARSDFVQGRVSRFVHERGGYRIWVDGGRFPVWIPEARISLFPRLRVGLSLRFGGYYDPLGYLEAYDYYNDGYYGGGYGGSAYSSGLLRGVVETVDYRRGTLVASRRRLRQLRDDAHPRPPSGNAASRRLRRDRRRLDARRRFRRPSPRGHAGRTLLIRYRSLMFKGRRGLAAFFVAPISSAPDAEPDVALRRRDLRRRRRARPPRRR